MRLERTGVRQLEQIVFRGDRAFAPLGDRFPYIDHAAEAGATGVHIWFWGDSYMRVSRQFIDYCHERGLSVHLGIGVGAYGVCDGEDPTDSVVQQRIKQHVARTLESQNIDGLEFQMGEYDWLEYKGESTRGKTMARQVINALNPMIDFALGMNPMLWIRTELWMIHFDWAGAEELSRELDPRCTVEWSDRTGPYQGPDRFGQGRALLAMDKRFSLFLKIYCDEDVQDGQYWRDDAADMSPKEIRRWIENWRSWVRLLYELDKRSLTILVNTERYVSEPLAFPAAAAMLARNPELAADEVLATVREGWH